jgi:hypothetical protein
MCEIEKHKERQKLTFGLETDIKNEKEGNLEKKIQRRKFREGKKKKENTAQL